MSRARARPSRPGRRLLLLVAVLVGGALTVGLMTGGGSGGADGGAGGGVAVPTPGPGDTRRSDGLPRPSLSWSRPRAPDAPVHATSDHVIVGRPGGGVAWLDRGSGRGGGTGVDWDDWHVLAATADAVVLAVEDRELVALEFVGDEVTVGHLGELADLGEALSGTDHVLRRAFPTSQHLYVLAGPTLLAIDPDARDRVIQQRWRFDRQHVLSAGTTGFGPYVVVVDGVVALDPTTGSQRWRRDLVTFDNRPHRVVEGAIVIGDDDGNVTALDAHSGDVRWQVSRGGPLAQELTIVDDLLVAAYVGGEVVAYRIADGTVVWRFERPGERYELVRGGNGVVVLSVPAGPGTSVRAVDASTGLDLWERPVGRLRDVLIDSGSVLVAAGSTVTAFEARSGDERWVLEAGSPARLVDADDDVVVADQERVRRVLPPAASGPE